MSWYLSQGSAFVTFLVFVSTANAQGDCSVYLQDLIFVDTVVIEDAVVLRYDHLRFSPYQESNVLLVPLCMLDSLKQDNDRLGFTASLRSCGYLFLHPDEADIAVEHLLYENPNIREAALYKHLELRLSSMIEDRIYRYDYSKSDTLRYYEINQTKFWFFLMRIEAYNRLQSDAKILVVGDKNEYVRMLVPITR